MESKTEFKIDKYGRTKIFLVEASTWQEPLVRSWQTINFWDLEGHRQLTGFRSLVSTWWGTSSEKIQFSSKFSISSPSFCCFPNAFSSLTVSQPVSYPVNTFIKVLWKYVCSYIYLSIYCISRPLLYKTQLKISNLFEASLPLNWNLLLIWIVMQNWRNSVRWNYQRCNVWFWFGHRSSVRELVLVPKVACFPIDEIV